MAKAAVVVSEALTALGPAVVDAVKAAAVVMAVVTVTDA